METGKVGWVGHPPRVGMVERMLHSQLPEEDKVPFMQFLGTGYDLTRSGEPVFPKATYAKWKQLVKK